MNKGRKFFYLFLGWLLLFNVAKAKAHFDNIHSFELDNGLQVVVIEKTPQPLLDPFDSFLAGSDVELGHVAC